MTGNEYQELAMRTNDGKADERLYDELKYNDGPVSSKCDVGELINGLLGLGGESGEVMDIVKKAIFHDKGIDLLHIKKELGDVVWYIAMICHACEFTLDEIMELNIEKLKARYPEGFDVIRANNRLEGDI